VSTRLPCNRELAQREQGRGGFSGSAKQRSAGGRAKSGPASTLDRGIPAWQIGAQAFEEGTAAKGGKLKDRERAGKGHRKTKIHTRGLANGASESGAPEDREGTKGREKGRARKKIHLAVNHLPGTRGSGPRGGSWKATTKKNWMGP